MNEIAQRKKRSLGSLIGILGPGFVSGAADNDPAGIATYTQVGAQFGYGQLWTALFALPLLIAVQEACARIGAVTGKGLAALIKEHYSARVLYAAVSIIVITNTINIGADIGAMAEALRLIVPIPFIVLVLSTAFITLSLEIFSSYRTYAKYLKALSAVALVYLLTAFIVKEPWLRILRATFVPHIELSFAFLLIILANIGTTIAPYLFFWETSQEVEEDKVAGRIGPCGTVTISSGAIANIRLDNAVGMFASQLITWSIIVVSATVLNQHGVTNLNTAADAAKALEPLVNSFPYAGFFAKLLFAIGIVSAGLLVVPVLAGSAAYALSESVGWEEGLNLKFKRAHGFYGIITASTLIGVVINFLGIDPIKLLVYTSVLNGVAAVPLIFLIIHISRNRQIMGDYVSGKLSLGFTWVAFGTMAGAAIAALFTFLHQS
jgi:NRAMP (natural resistance-associated macrophage protein)-like metal ion transporter